MGINTSLYFPDGFRLEATGVGKPELWDLGIDDYSDLRGSAFSVLIFFHNLLICYVYCPDNIFIAKIKFQLLFTALSPIISPFINITKYINHSDDHVSLGVKYFFYLLPILFTDHVPSKWQHPQCLFLCHSNCMFPIDTVMLTPKHFKKIHLINNCSSRRVSAASLRNHQRLKQRHSIDYLQDSLIPNFIASDVQCFNES